MTLVAPSVRRPGLPRTVLAALVALVSAISSLVLVTQAEAALGVEHRSGQVYARVGATDIVLGNGLVERRWSRTRFATTALLDLRDGGLRSTATHRDFALRLGPTTIGSDQLTATAVSATTFPGGIRLRITLGGLPGVQVTRVVEAYEGIAGIRSQTRIRPTAPLPLSGYTLDEVSVGAATPTLHALRAGADWREPEWTGPPLAVGDAHAGTWRETVTASAGAPLSAAAQWATAARPSGARAFLVMERADLPSSRGTYDGQALALDVDLSRDVLVLGPFEEQVHVENPLPTPGRARVLPAGRETVLEPAFVGVALSADEEPVHHARYLEERRLQPAAYRRDVVFNSNGTDADVISTGAKDDMDLATIREVAPTERALGIDTFVLDDGWQSVSGDWYPDSPEHPEPRWDGVPGSKFEPRFPDSTFAAVREAIAPMRLGLWMSPLHFNPASETYKAHPEWACAPVGHALSVYNTADPDSGSNEAGIGQWVRGAPARRGADARGDRVMGGRVLQARLHRVARLRRAGRPVPAPGSVHRDVGPAARRPSARHDPDRRDQRLPAVPVRVRGARAVVVPERLAGTRPAPPQPLEPEPVRPDALARPARARRPCLRAPPGRHAHGGGDALAHHVLQRPARTSRRRGRGSGAVAGVLPPAPRPARRHGLPAAGRSARRGVDGAPAVGCPARAGVAPGVPPRRRLGDPARLPEGDPAGATLRPHRGTHRRAAQDRHVEAADPGHRRHAPGARHREGLPRRPRQGHGAGDDGRAFAGYREWLAGDLHVHTCYSHDAYCGPDDDNTGPEELYTLSGDVEERFLEASVRGLDFLAITDHNDTRSARDPGFGSHGVVGVPGYEGSLDGHAQVLGITEVLDEGTADAAAVNRLAEELRRGGGGLLQVNHAAEGLVEPFECDRTDLLDWGYGYDVVPDTIEVWNIQHYFQPPMPSASANAAAIRYWECWLDRGARIGATGGSDAHWLSTSLVQGPGNPTTWVDADARSTAAVLRAIRAGRTSVGLVPPALGGAPLLLEADVDGDGTYEASTGDTVPPGTPMRVRSAGGGAGLVDVRANGTDLVVGAPLTPGGEVRFRSPADQTMGWVRATLSVPDAAAERALTCEPLLGGSTTYCRAPIAVVALTSPIYLR